MKALGAERTSILFTDLVGNRIGSVQARETSGGSWERTDSEVSAMDTNFTAASRALSDLEPWLHIANVYRGDEVVWRGFVYTTAVQGNQVSVTGRDPSVIFDRRRIAQDRVYRDADLSDIAAEIIRDAIAIGDPFNMQGTMMVAPTGVYATRTVTAESRMVAEELKDLVEAGLTWSVHGGRLLIGPVGTGHTTAALADSDLDAKVVISKDGADTINDLLVLGKTATGTWYDYTSPLGVLQGIEKKDALTDAAQCTNAARAIVKSRGITPRRVTLPGSSKLMATAPVAINELIVNANVPLLMAQTGVTIDQLMRVSAVSVKYGPSSDEVSLTLVEPRGELAPNELAAPPSGYEVKDAKTP